MRKKIQISTVVEKAYFNWLCDKIDRRTSSRFQNLLSNLYNYEFYGLIPNDDNRAVDGLKLREAFARETEFKDAECDINKPCTVLEMLIALAMRMEHLLFDPLEGDRTPKWFWIMIDNLKLDPLDSEDNPRLEIKLKRNDIIIKRFVNRRYTPNGYGGIFPLRRSINDQRTVEIWYQMMFYIEEVLF